MSDQDNATEQPLERLLRMQHEALTAGGGQPQAEAEPRMGGLVFGVGDARLLVSLTDISDIVECGAPTPIPRSKPWLRGVANIRGKLYSIVDFDQFLGLEPTRGEGEGKYMVINRPEIGAALLVKAVYGLRYFDESQELKGMIRTHPKVRPYVQKAYQLDDEVWGVLDVDLLVQAPEFRDVRDDA